MIPSIVRSEPIGLVCSDKFIFQQRIDACQVAVVRSRRVHSGRSHRGIGRRRCSVIAFLKYRIKLIANLRIHFFNTFSLFSEQEMYFKTDGYVYRSQWNKQPLKYKQNVSRTIKFSFIFLDKCQKLLLP